MSKRKIRGVILGVVLIMLAMFSSAYAASTYLDNGIVKAEFGSRGLLSLLDVGLNKTFHFTNDNCSVTVAGVAINTSSLTPTVDTSVANSIRFLFSSGTYRIKVIYEIKPGWRFVSRRIELTSTVAGSFRVNSVTSMTAKITETIAKTTRAASATGVVFIRSSAYPGVGLMLAQQNSFLNWTMSSGTFTMKYTPEIDWKDTYGAFQSDRVCIGTYQLSGTAYPANRRSEWQWSATEPANDGFDWAEIEAAQNCVRAFLLFDTSKAVRLDVGWCSNDYQIDTGTAEGRTEHKRMIDRCKELGINNLLYTPGNNLVAPIAKNTDAWSWENVLWHNMGQKIRTGEFIAGTSTLPPSVQEMVDYANSKNVGLVTYIYPSLGFKQNPEWTAWCGGNTGGYTGVDTGVRSFQDWFVQQMVDFHNNVGATGYSFDHWWIAYDSQTGNPPVSSRYSQWYGCRRILENLRAADPDCIIDGRQQYQGFGPWTWLAGSYPHPTSTDEQPASFRAFPDLHTDRVSANRQRYTAYWFRMDQLAPPEVTPGFITHQTQRSGPEYSPRYTFRARDWDTLGWKFSLFSTIGTAPFNLVMNMIPARDINEFNALSEADKQYFRYWFDWVDSHIDYMRVLRPITSSPAIGRIDGTAAILNDNGYIFLFNPNYRKMDATFKLDTSIGLKSGASFIIKELDPLTGRLIGKPSAGSWTYGDTVTITMEGTSYLVLEVKPAVAPLPLTLFNITGNVALNGGVLQLTGASGEVGSVQSVCVAVPSGATVNSFTANGVTFPFTRSGDVVTANVRFAGQKFSRSQQVGTFDPTFTGTTVTGTFAIPQRIFTQLANRRSAWPVPYTDDDLLATWLGADRLFLYIHIADPNPGMAVSAKIDGITVPVKRAYNGIYTNSGDQTFTGYYIDASKMIRDIQHQIEVTIPSFAAGRFQGLYFDNVETEYTQTTTDTVVNPTLYTVSGRVTSTTGGPIAGATVYISDTPNASVSPLTTATTDASGNYTRTLPNASNWYVCAGASTHNTSADQSVAINGASVSNINFSLVPNARISGKVVKKSDGTALAGAFVYFSRFPNASGNPTFTATTDASGNYTQLVQDGKWYISAGAINYYCTVDQIATMSGADLSGINFALSPSVRNIPRTADLLFSAITESFAGTSGNTGNWATYMPSGKTLTATGSPEVEIIGGAKWEKNIYGDRDGYQQGSYTAPIAINGATIVVAARPTRNGIRTDWTSIVDILYNRLTLGIRNDTGRVVVKRNGDTVDSSVDIPNGQTTILSMVVQPTGQYKVYANGEVVINNTGTSDMTSLVPNVAGTYANRIFIGCGVDSWQTFNGNIGDVFVYKAVLTDAERLQLETDLANKFGVTVGNAFTIASSAGVGGTISPSGAVVVSAGSSQGFIITPDAGYAIEDVKVDDVSVGAVTTYTFPSVTSNHSISATFIALPSTISGSVTDLASGAAIAGASVYISTSANPSANPAYTIITDAVGNYSQSMPAGTWYVAAVKAGYDLSVDQTATTAAGGSAILNFTLSLSPANGPEVLYKFDETSGITASDSSGSGKNGALTHGPVWATGKVGNCLSFDGSNDYVSVPDLGDYAAMTISAWVNIDSLGTDATGSAIVACDGTDAGDIQLLILKSGGKVRFSLVGNTVVDSDSNYAFTTADFGKWRHVAVVYDSVAKTVKFYINGGLNATTTLATTRVATLSSGVRVGGWSGGRYFDGKIDDFHIYGRALSGAEIAGIVNSSPSIKIAEAKKLANGELVTLADKVVIYAPRNASNARSTNYFYIEEPDRSAGIMVHDGSTGQDSVNADTPVTVSGVMKTISYSGQRYVELSTMPGPGTAGVVNPLGMTTRSILTDPASVGLLVRVAGKVSSLSVDEGWFNITDGYGVDTLVICETGIPLSGFVVGDTVAVTGAVGKDAIFTVDPVGMICLKSFVKL